MKSSKKIIKALISYGPMSRAELSKKLGLSASSITDITSAMLDEGVILERGYKKSDAKGRKNILLDLDTSYKFVLGIGVFKSVLCVGLVTVKGETLCRRIFELDGESRPLCSDFIFKTAKSAAEDIIRDCCIDESRLIGAGVCASSNMRRLLGIENDSIQGYKIPVVVESADEYLEYSGGYMPINPQELYMFGCAKVIREIFC